MFELIFQHDPDQQSQLQQPTDAGLGRSEARRLEALEQENARLKKLLADAMLDNAILKEAASGNF